MLGEGSGNISVRLAPLLLLFHRHLLPAGVRQAAGSFGWSRHGPSQVNMAVVEECELGAVPGMEQGHDLPWRQGGKRAWWGRNGT